MSLRYFIIAVLIFNLGCGSTNKVKDGATAFQYKQYNKAIDLLKKEYNKSDRQVDKGKKAYLLAESYTKLSDYSAANEWYAKADQMDYGIEALSGLARTFMNLEDYGRAIENYSIILQRMPGNKAVERSLYICKQALKWSEDDPDNYSLRKILQDGSYANYSPALYENNLLVFTSDRSSATGSKTYEWTGNKMSDLFVIDKNGGKSRRFDAFINSGFNEGTATFNQDYSQMIFTRCFNNVGTADDYCKLMVAEKVNQVWSEPKVMPFVNDNTNYGQPTLIENDSVLVFSSISKDGANGFDLWYSVSVKGDWSDPIPMPASINTPGNEYFPTSDGDTVYYSSDYLPGLGGLDIFKTYLKTDGTWQKPMNMKFPFNSGGDDFGLVIDRKGRMTKNIEAKGYFTSIRNSSKHEEIYYFETYKSAEEEPVDEEANEIDEANFTLYIAGKVLENIFQDPDNPNSKVIKKQRIREPYVKVTDKSGKELDINANSNGLFIGNLNLNQDYIIIAKKVGYLNTVTNLTTKDIKIKEGETSKTINVEIILEKIFRGKEIILDNIYYDFDKSEIRVDARPTLDILANKLIQNPQIKIELSSHTDCVGEIEYNKNLSQERAQSAVDYLISKGVDATRIVPAGYGESDPIDNCECTSCSEDQHQRNRRTSFKIL